jgi:hypothetical protein
LSFSLSSLRNSVCSGASAGSRSFRISSSACAGDAHRRLVDGFRCFSTSVLIWSRAGCGPSGTSGSSPRVQRRRSSGRVDGMRPRSLLEGALSADEFPASIAVLRPNVPAPNRRRVPRRARYQPQPLCRPLVPGRMSNRRDPCRLG